MRLLKLALVACLALLTLLLMPVIVLLWPPPLGIDLVGGVRLVYEVDPSRLAEDGDHGGSPAAMDWGALLQAVGNRVNPSGSGEVTVRKLDDGQIEIVLPQIDPAEPERVKKLLSASGHLEFRVLANRTDDEALVQQAEQLAKDPNQRKSQYVKVAGRAVGLWAHVGRESREIMGGIRPLKVNVVNAVVRDAATGELLRVPENLPRDEEHAFEHWLQERGIEQIDVLLVTDDGFDVTGSHLTRISRGYDEVGQPCILFEMGSQGASLMEGLTSINLPDERRGTYRLLGIVLDGTLLSAPRVMSTISDSGRITGQFTPEEVDFIVGVLQAGSLPVDLGDAPITEVSFGPNEAWRQTLVSIVLATLGLLVVIWSLALVRYRVLGLAVAWSNLLQLLLMLAVIEVVRLPVTMPAVLAAAALLLVAAVGNAWICESVHRAKRQGHIPPGQVGRSLVVGAAPLAALLGLLWFASVFVYILFDAPLRSTAAVVNLGSMAAMATSCLCLPFLIGILAARWPDPTQEADVVAELVDSDGPLNG